MELVNSDLEILGKGGGGGREREFEEGLAMFFNPCSFFFPRRYFDIDIESVNVKRKHRLFDERKRKFDSD